MRSPLGGELGAHRPLGGRRSPGRDVTHNSPSAKVNRRSLRSQSPAGGSSRVGYQERSRTVRRDAVDRPRGRSSRWCAVLSGEGNAGRIHVRRPALRSPLLCHGCNHGRVGRLLGHPLYDEVELTGGEAQCTARVACEVSTLARPLSCFKPEGSIGPERTDARHMWASVAVDRRQPARVSIRSPRTGSLAKPSREAVFDDGPVDGWQPIEVRKICRLHHRDQS